MADADKNIPSERPRSHIEVLLHQKIDTGMDSKREISRANGLGRTTRRSSQCRQLSPLSERRLRAREKEDTSGLRYLLISIVSSRRCRNLKFETPHTQAAKGNDGRKSVAAESAE